MSTMLAMRAKVAPFLAMEMMREASTLEEEGNTILHMEVGQPGHALPDEIFDKISASMRENQLGYTNASGLDSLKTLITNHYKETYNEDVAPERIFITTGSSSGFILSFLSTLNAGEKIGLPVPGYPAYRNIIKALDLLPVSIRTHGEDIKDAGCEHFIENIDEAIKNNIKGFLIASPNNPTGTIVEENTLINIAKTCEEQNIWFYSDEIYHGLNYFQTPKTAANLSSNSIVINSFSKYFGMTGWRIGWLVLPQTLVKPIEHLAQSLYIAPPTISQLAAIEVLKNKHLFQDTQNYYAQNRSILIEALEKAQIPYFPADGAFYIYADISQTGLDGLSFSKQMLFEQHVALTPGVDFDPEQGQNLIRMSYAGTKETIQQAAFRLLKVLKNC